MMRSAAPRAVLAVAGSIVAFATLIERAGLLPAVAATVAIASVGDGAHRPRQIVVLAVCLAAAAWLVFVALLDQPLPLLRGL